jgi:hypothetical protein
MFAITEEYSLLKHRKWVLMYCVKFGMEEDNPLCNEMYPYIA